MSIPSEKIKELTSAIRRTEEYRRYQRVRTELDRRSDLKQQMDEFRRERYRMQQFGADMYAATDEIQQRYSHLWTEPLVTEYLELENHICRTIRETCNEIVREIPLDLPNID